MKSCILIRSLALTLTGPLSTIVEADEGAGPQGSQPVATPMRPWRPRNVPRHMRHSLPTSLIDQARSPDRKLVAQLMHAEPGPVYYLAIIDRRRGHRYYLDKRLIVGEQYPFQQMRVFWKNAGTAVIEARHASEPHVLVIEYNHRDGSLLEGKRLDLPKAPARDKLRPEDLKPVRLASLDQRMLLHRQVPMGVSYDALKQAMPALSFEKADAGRDLTEAFLEIEVMGRKAQVEFNFNNHALYNFTYHMSLESAEEAGAVYRQLQDYYSRLFGEHEEENVRESEHYAVESSVWETDEAVVSVVNNLSPGSHHITWALRQ